MDLIYWSHIQQQMKERTGGTKEIQARPLKLW